MKHITKAAVIAMAEPQEWLRITPEDRLRFAVNLQIRYEHGIYSPHMRWTGLKNGIYGTFKFRSDCKAHPQMIVGAHVFAYFNCYSLYLPAPSELKTFDVGHTCTEHLCCEPLHLYLGTHAANMEEVLKYRDGDVPAVSEGITI